MKAGKTLVATLAPITLAMGLSLGAMQAHAGSHGGMKSYAADTGKDVVMSGFGECWQASGGMKAKIEACGDKVAMPAKAPMDSDKDGVMDSADACPGTPRGVPVDTNGCPKDSDGDGVTDAMDKCPNTRASARAVEVDMYGCEVVGSITINTTSDHFDFDSAKLKDAMMSALDDVASKLAASPADESVSVVGHTDSTGPAAYNQILSERRAQAAADYLSGKGVKNISVSGQGESSPVADNGTREGRAANRRVEIHAR